MKQLIFFLIAAFAFGSCTSKFQKLLQSSDATAKYDAGMLHYTNKDYYKAQLLLESISSFYRGSEKEENLTYTLAMCYYQQGEYIMAESYYKRVAKTFPTSERAAECQYYCGYSNYMMSPRSSLDQTFTEKAIAEFELFQSKYPNNADWNAKATQYVGELHKKLEIKAYDNAYLYYKTRSYKAASIAMKNFLDKYPDTEKREDALYIVAKSSFLLAENSVESKKIERYEQTVNDCYAYADKFPSGKYAKETERMKETASKKSKE